MTKKIVQAKLEELSIYDLEGKLEDVIKNLSELGSKYGSNLVIDISIGDYYADVRLYQTREETDQEYQFRLSSEQAQTAFRENQERLKYEELKKKYG
jgi:hypothetical protein